MQQENHSQSSAGESGRQLVLASNLILRVADTNEIVDDIVDIVIRSTLDSPYSSLPIDKGSIERAVIEFCNSDITNKVLILLKEGIKIVGFIAGVVQHSHPLAAKVKIATELVWWVDPDYRGRKDSLALLEAFEAWATELKCSHIVIAHFNNDIGRGLSKLYTKKGYSKLEESYMKEIK